MDVSPQTSDEHDLAPLLHRERMEASGISNNNNNNNSVLTTNGKSSTTQNPLIQHNLLSVASSHLNPHEISPRSVNSRFKKSPQNKSLSSASAHSDQSGAVPVVVLSPQEQVELQRRQDAEKAARAALYTEEYDEEVNLTLWEQAAWNAKVYAIVESGSFPSDIPPAVERASIIVALITTIVIGLSCASILALSFPIYIDGPPGYWSAVEVFCVVIFTSDLVIRLLSCPNRKHFAMDFFNWVDILSILPYYVGLFGTSNLPWYLRIIRALRIARLVKVLKARGILGLKALLKTMVDSISGVILFLIVAGTGLLIFSTMIYFSERGTFDHGTYLWWRTCVADKFCNYTDPTNTSGLNDTTASLNNFTYVNPFYQNSSRSGSEISPFQSIAGSLWFTIDTMTTTGTGEIQAASTAGRFLTGMMTFAGIFFMGIPTMILAGTHVASKAMQTEQIVRNSWADLLRRKRRLMSTVLGSISIVRRYFGWTKLSDCAWEILTPSEEEIAAQEAAANIFHNHPPPDDQGLTLAIPDNRQAAVLQKMEQQRQKMKSHAKEKAAVVVGFYRVHDQVRQIRMNLQDPNEFLYEPVLVLAREPDGRPRGKVVWAESGLPTLVQFDLVLDDDDTRSAVSKVASQLNASARIRCDAHSGLSIHHSSPLEVLRHQIVDEKGNEVIQSVIRWSMLPVRSRPGFREREFPIFFRRSGGDWDDPTQHQDDSERYTERDLIDDALSSLLGSGLLVECLIPVPPVRRRVMVVTQYLQRTKLHRELELLAHRSSRDLPYAELTAFITESDFCRLLEGVARRIELIDPSLVIEDLAAVEKDIAQVILRRLRHIRVVQIPTKYRRCVYNSEVLQQDDMVYEVPLNMFDGDENDEVEQDSMGYIEVTARASYGRAYRVDFAVSMASSVHPTSPGMQIGEVAESFMVCE